MLTKTNRAKFSLQEALSAFIASVNWPFLQRFLPFVHPVPTSILHDLRFLQIKLSVTCTVCPHICVNNGTQVVYIREKMLLDLQSLFSSGGIWDKQTKSPPASQKHNDSVWKMQKRNSREFTLTKQKTRQNTILFLTICDNWNSDVFGIWLQGTITTQDTTSRSRCGFSFESANGANAFTACDPRHKDLFNRIRTKSHTTDRNILFNTLKTRAKWTSSDYSPSLVQIVIISCPTVLLSSIWNKRIQSITQL